MKTSRLIVVAVVALVLAVAGVAGLIRVYERVTDNDDRLWALNVSHAAASAGAEPYGEDQALRDLALLRRSGYPHDFAGSLILATVGDKNFATAAERDYQIRWLAWMKRGGPDNPQDKIGPPK